MIDFHTHILPGIDDGSRDIDMTTEMLGIELSSGVDRIVLTPHFYASRISIEDFLSRREQSLETVIQATAGQTRPDLLTGAEVYFFPGMGSADKLKELCVGDTDVILIEMPFMQWDQTVLSEIQTVIRKQKMRVVLAHVERYPEFQKDKRIWEQVLQLPLTIQINAGSFLKGWGKRRFCLKMLKEHDNVIIGSDCHNLTSRRPNLTEARDVIGKKLGQGRLDLLDRTANELLKK